MKRIGRRGRVLGTERPDADMLDEVTQKYLLQAAGITMDVLQEMSKEETKETLSAILESSPLLIQKYLQERSEVNVANMSTCGSGMSDPEKRMKASQSIDIKDRPTKNVLGSDSDSDSLPDVSSACLKDEPQLDTGVRLESRSENLPLKFTQTARTAVMGIIRESSSPSSLDRHPQLDPDSDEEETQRYDMEKYDLLMADTEKSPDKIKQKLTSSNIILETQAADSNSDSRTEDEEVDLFSTSDHNVTQEETSESDHTSSHIKLQPSMESKQSALLSSMYRKHGMQDKIMFWSSPLAPERIKDPNCYTQVIQLLFDIYIARVRRAHKQMDGKVKTWGKPVVTGPHVPGCLIAKSPDVDDGLFQDGKNGDGWRRTLRSTLLKDRKVEKNVANRQIESDRDDVDDFDLKFARICKQEQDGQDRVPDSSDKFKKDIVKRVRGCRQYTQYVVDERDDVNEDTVESDSDEWIPGQNKKAKLAKRNLKTYGDRKWTQVKQNSDCRKGYKGKKNDISEAMCDDFDGECSSVVNKEKKAYEGKREADKQTWIRNEHEDRLKGSSIVTQKRCVSPGQEDSTTYPSVANCHTLEDVYSDTNDDVRIDDQDIEESLHLHLEVEDSYIKSEQFGVSRCDDEYRLYWTNMSATPRYVSEHGDNSKDEQDSIHRNTRSAATVVAVLSDSQSSVSLYDQHNNLFVTQMSRSCSPPSQNNVRPFTSLFQQDIQQALQSQRSADLSNISSVEQSLIKSNKADTKVLITGNKSVKNGTDQLVTHLTGHRSSKLELSRNPAERDDNNKIEHEFVTKERIDDKVDNVKDWSNVTRPKGESRKRNLLTMTKTGPNWTSPKDSVVGKTVQKRQKMDCKSENNATRSRTMGRNKVLIVTETSERGTVEEVDLDVTVTDNADSSLDYQNNTRCSLGKQIVAKQEEAMVSDNMCPICGKCFHASKIEAHASTCGEVEADQVEHVRCVTCGLEVPQELLRAHQAICLHDIIPTKRITRSTRD